MLVNRIIHKKFNKYNNSNKYSNNLKSQKW